MRDYTLLGFDQTRQYLEAYEQVDVDLLKEAIAEVTEKSEWHGDKRVGYLVLSLDGTLTAQTEDIERYLYINYDFHLTQLIGLQTQGLDIFTNKQVDDLPLLITKEHLHEHLEFYRRFSRSKTVRR